MLGLAALERQCCQCSSLLCPGRQAHTGPPDQPVGPAQACCRPGWPACGWHRNACPAAHLAPARPRSTFGALCALQPGEHYAVLMGPSWTALEHELAYTMHCSIRGYWDQWNKQQSLGSIRLPAPQVSLCSPLRARQALPLVWWAIMSKCVGSGPVPPIYCYLFVSHLPLHASIVP